MVGHSADQSVTTPRGRRCACVSEAYLVRRAHGRSARAMHIRRLSADILSLMQLRGIARRVHAGPTSQSMQAKCITRRTPAPTSWICITRRSSYEDRPAGTAGGGRGGGGAAAGEPPSPSLSFEATRNPRNDSANWVISSGSTYLVDGLAPKALKASRYWSAIVF